LYGVKIGHFESRLEILGKYYNVVLEKNGEDQLDRSRKNEEELHRVEEDRNVLHAIK
jgi:hypothetical protein